MKIYVGNLPFKMTLEELSEMFEAFGSVADAVIINDRETGRSKGFGFIEMSEDQAAKAAIDALNGEDVGGRALTVNEARPREERSRR
ncbi:MAG: RNA-binding protein [Pseudomonadales bacterium]|nr:RNA-binding protein [Pseudomonadales bacterium]